MSIKTPDLCERSVEHCSRFKLCEGCPMETGRCKCLTIEPNTPCPYFEEAEDAGKHSSSEYGLRHDTRVHTEKEGGNDEADALMDVIRQHEYRLATKNGSIDYGMFTRGIQQVVDEQPMVPAVRCCECKFGVTPYDGWISVDDRLPIEEAKAHEQEWPGEYCEFLVMIEKGSLPTTLYYDLEENEWFRINTALERETYKVTHWMPLPQPPKGE